MKKYTVISLFLVVLFSCSSKTGTSGYVHFIHKDSANRMISSYLHSLVSDTSLIPDLHSLIISADELRTYLADPAIRQVKLMFAHKLEYINSGNEGQYAGYRSDALTLILGGYDHLENYIFAQGLTVPDHCIPCPENCPRSGTASMDLLH